MSCLLTITSTKNDIILWIQILKKKKKKKKKNLKSKLAQTLKDINYNLEKILFDMCLKKKRVKFNITTKSYPFKGKIFI